MSPRDIKLAYCACGCGAPLGAKKPGARYASDACRAKSPPPRDIACPYCGGMAHRVGGAVIYPHRPDLAAKQFYLCAPCDAYCGTHPGGAPLGMPANAELRRARNHVHRVFDPLWQRAAEVYGGWNYRIKNTARVRAYEWLAEHMGIETSACHVAMFDLEQCRQAWRVIRDHQPDAAGIRRWAKERRADLALRDASREAHVRRQGGDVGRAGCE